MVPPPRQLQGQGRPPLESSPGEDEGGVGIPDVLRRPGGVGIDGELHHPVVLGREGAVLGEPSPGDRPAVVEAQLPGRVEGGPVRPGLSSRYYLQIFQGHGSCSARANHLTAD